MGLKSSKVIPNNCDESNILAGGPENIGLVMRAIELFKDISLMFDSLDVDHIDNYRLSLDRIISCFNEMTELDLKYMKYILKVNIGNGILNESMMPIYESCRRKVYTIKSPPIHNDINESVEIKNREWKNRKREIREWTG